MKRCSICQVSKGKATNAGLYMPLLAHSIPWTNVIMDFIMAYLEFNEVLIQFFLVLGWFSEMAHFISCKKNDRFCSHSVVIHLKKCIIFMVIHPLFCQIWTLIFSVIFGKVCGIYVCKKLDFSMRITYR